jgi:hypothetical protein
MAWIFLLAHDYWKRAHGNPGHAGSSGKCTDAMQRTFCAPERWEHAKSENQCINRCYTDRDVIYGAHPLRFGCNSM